MGAGIMEEILAGQVQDGFIPMMEKVRDYILAFMDQPIQVMVNSQPTEITPQSIEGAYDLTPTIGDRMFSKSAELQKALFLMKTTAEMLPILMQEGKKPDFSKILERVYGFAGWKDYNAIVRSIPQGPTGTGQPDQGIAGAGGPTQNGAGGGEQLPPELMQLMQQMQGMAGQGEPGAGGNPTQF
jgi:hypothetical protein